MTKNKEAYCPYCLNKTLRYTQQNWVTTGEKTVRLIMVCETCSRKSVWKLEDLMGD